MTFYYRNGGQWVPATNVKTFYGSTATTGGGGGGIQTGMLEDFEDLAQGDDLSSVTGWTSYYPDSIYGDESRAFGGGVSAWASSGYAGYGSYEGDGLGFYPELPCTIRYGVYIDQGSYDAIFCAGNPASDINYDCYRLRGSGSTTTRTTGHTIELKETNATTTLETSTVEPPMGTWLDHAIDVEVVDGEVNISWVGWEWTGTQWVQFDSIGLAWDPNGVWSTSRGIGIGINDGDGVDLGVSFDSIRVREHGDSVVEPRITP